jgi:hypothetical protein
MLTKKKLNFTKYESGFIVERLRPLPLSRQIFAGAWPPIGACEEDASM